MKSDVFCKLCEKHLGFVHAGEVSGTLVAHFHKEHPNQLFEVAQDYQQFCETKEKYGLGAVLDLAFIGLADTLIRERGGNDNREKS